MTDRGAASARPGHGRRAAPTRRRSLRSRLLVVVGARSTLEAVLIVEEGPDRVNVEVRHPGAMKIVEDIIPERHPRSIAHDDSLDAPVGGEAAGGVGVGTGLSRQPIHRAV